MSIPRVGDRPPDPSRALARSWWLTAALCVVVAPLAALYRTVWSTVAAVLLASVAVLAATQGRRARGRPVTATVAATVAGLFVGAVVLSIVAIAATRR